MSAILEQKELKKLQTNTRQNAGCSKMCHPEGEVPAKEEKTQLPEEARASWDLWGNLVTLMEIFIHVYPCLSWLSKTQDLGIHSLWWFSHEWRPPGSTCPTCLIYIALLSSKNLKVSNCINLSFSRRTEKWIKIPVTASSDSSEASWSVSVFDDNNFAEVLDVAPSRSTLHMRLHVVRAC